MLPHVRPDDELIVTHVADELVIYDQKQDLAHALNPTAAYVFKHCDGQTSPEQLAALLAQEHDLAQAEELVWLTLDRLDKANLLRGKVNPPTGVRLSRRDFLKLGVMAALLPVIATIVAPTPARASTPPDEPEPEPWCSHCYVYSGQYGPVDLGGMPQSECFSQLNTYVGPIGWVDKACCQGAAGSGTGQGCRG